MNADTTARLLEINYQFYQNFAGSFSATRRRLQPGVWRILEGFPATARLLDLGCGNGELARQLLRRGQQGVYLGLDFSQGLLDEAWRAVEPYPRDGLAVDFRLANLAEADWGSTVPETGPLAPPFEMILAFAVLHHIPGVEMRRRILARAAHFLHSGGRLIHSEWQFLNSPRLAERCLPWGMAGLSAEQVDPGDYLLDWRREGNGLRYVHYYAEEELNELAIATGFRVVETFYADGEGGRLGLYQVWEKQ